MDLDKLGFPLSETLHLLGCSSLCVLSIFQEDDSLDGTLLTVFDPEGGLLCSEVDEILEVCESFLLRDFL